MRTAWSRTRPSMVRTNRIARRESRTSWSAACHDAAACRVAHRRDSIAARRAVRNHLPPSPLRCPAILVPPATTPEGSMPEAPLAAMLSASARSPSKPLRSAAMLPMVLSAALLPAVLWTTALPSSAEARSSPSLRSAAPEASRASAWSPLRASKPSPRKYPYPSKRRHVWNDS